MDNKARTSQDNFYKKVGSSRGFIGGTQSSTNFYIPQNKGDNFTNIIQMLKTDLLSIQDLINKNSKDIKMYKILSKNPLLTKKLTDIEQTLHINAFIEKINEQSNNIEKISKIYNCKSNNELIQKLYLELGYNDLLIKKICDFFILMKLKLCKDDTYTESISKIIPIKDFIEKIENIVNTSSSTTKPLVNNNINNNINAEVEEYLKLSTLNELFDYDMKGKRIFLHTNKIVNDYFRNLNINITEKITKYDAAPLKNLNNFKGKDVDKYFKLKEIFENILEQYKIKSESNISKNNNNINIENDKLKKELNELKEKYEKDLKNSQNKINELNNQIELLKSQNINNINKDLKYTEKDFNDYKLKFESKNNNNNNEKLIKELNDKIKDLENELNNEREKKNNSNSSEKIIQVEKVDINQMMKKHEDLLNKLHKETNSKLDNEIKDLTIKFNKLREENNNLKLENSDFKKKLSALQGKNFDPESYEAVLLEQFETMKAAFVKKVDALTTELNENKSNSRRQIYDMQNELSETKNLKNIFLQQVISLQKLVEKKN